MLRYFEFIIVHFDLRIHFNDHLLLGDLVLGKVYLTEAALAYLLLYFVLAFKEFLQIFYLLDWLDDLDGRLGAGTTCSLLVQEIAKVSFHIFSILLALDKFDGL